MPTSIETEIKLRVDDLPDLLRRLRQLGARSRGRVFERNVVYDTPTADFRRTGRLLRLRTEATQNGRRHATLTSKVPPDQLAPHARRNPAARRYKVRLESEAGLRDRAATARLLKKIGLRPSFRYEKYRTTFRLGALRLEVDETPIGTFLEIEGGPAMIDRIARKLGYAPAAYIRRTYWDLYAADCARRGKKPRNMVFSRKNHH